jgi:Fe-S cluster assembly iron-binding protein IscA
MIVIWKGAGILVAVIWFTSIFTGDWVARKLFGPDASMALHNLTCQWLAAIFTLGLALILRTQRESRLDPDSGQTVVVPAGHSLFFIPVIVWPAIFFLIGIVIYFSAPTPSPELFGATPAAVAKVTQVAAAKSLPKVWHVRLEAYWPKGVSSPRYSVELATNLDRARDYAFETSGIKIVVLKRQVEMLRGAQLDFGEQDGEEKFQVSNPNFEGEKLKKWKRDLELEHPDSP